jgi:hypothetical protein
MSVLYVSEVEGMGELAKAMEGFRRSAQRRLFLKALVEGAKPLRAAIRTAAPVGKVARPKQSDKPGNLRASVRYKASRSSTGSIAYMIGPFGKGSAHRHRVIAGHVITGHKPNKVKGGHSEANDFVRRGEEKARGEAFDAIGRAAKSAFESDGKP